MPNNYNTMTIKLDIALNVASEVTICEVNDEGLIHRNGWDDNDKGKLVKWDDVSLYLIDFVELYREVYKIHGGFANEKIAPLYHKSLLREGFTEKQANLISGEAYDRGHSAGQDEVISYIREIANFAKDIIEAGKK